MTTRSSTGQFAMASVVIVVAVSFLLTFAIRNWSPSVDLNLARNLAIAGLILLFAFRMRSGFSTSHRAITVLSGLCFLVHALLPGSSLLFYAAMPLGILAAVLYVMRLQQIAEEVGLDR